MSAYPMRPPPAVEYGTSDPLPNGIPHQQTTPPPTEAEALREQLVADGVRRAQLVAAKREIEAEVADIDARTAATLGEGEHPQYGVNITRGLQFDADRAARVIGQLPGVGTELLARVTVTVPTVDRKLAKELLPPAVYRLCQKPNDKVTVKWS